MSTRSTGQSGIARRDFLKGAAATAAATFVSAGIAPIAFAEEANKQGDTDSNRVCEILGIEKPVVQALMNELTSPELASAVSNAGGLGILGMPEQENIDKTKKLTDKPFGVALYDYNENYAKTLKDSGINIVIFAAGGAAYDNGYTINTEPIEKFKADGFTVMYKALNATIDNMKAAQKAGADILIPIGYGSGGCGPYIDVPIVQYLTEYKDQIDAPMLAAGGIVNTDTAAAAATAGAEGAYVGTRFLASTENPADDKTKKVVVESRAEDLVLMPCSPGLVRCTRTPMSEKVLKMASEGASTEEIDEVSGVMINMWLSMREGTFEDYAVGMSSAVNNITSIMDAKEIVDMIAAGFDK